MRLSASEDVSLDGLPQVERAFRRQRRGWASCSSLVGRLGLSWKVADDEEKTGRWHVSVSQRVRGQRVVPLSALVRMVPPIRAERREDSTGALARHSHSYVVLPNRQFSTRLVVPRHNTSGGIACQLEQEAAGAKRDLSFTKKRVDSGI